MALNPTHEVYFIAWAFDMSGRPVNFYPGKDFEPSDMLIPIKAGKVREFVGEGINIFPSQQVTGGIVVRIQLWESAKKYGNWEK